VHEKIHITIWDPEHEEAEKVIKKPKDFPEGAVKIGNITLTTLMDTLTQEKTRSQDYTSK
jgi:hypothetical protein